MSDEELMTKINALVPDFLEAKAHVETDKAKYTDLCQQIRTLVGRFNHPVYLPTFIMSIL